MNYLQLVQALHRLLRTTGDAPTTVRNQTGINDELVFFVRQAWLDIQNSHPGWRFLWREGLLTLPLGSDVVSPATLADYGAPILAESEERRFITLRGSPTESESPVDFVPFPAFQQSTIDRGTRGPGQPSRFTILPDGRLRFDALADRAYTVRLNYRRTPQTLVDDADIPLCAEFYRMAIVWWAIVRYYCTTRDGAERLRQKAMVELQREMQKLNNNEVMEALIPEGML